MLLAAEATRGNPELVWVTVSIGSSIALVRKRLLIVVIEKGLELLTSGTVPIRV